MKYKMIMILICVFIFTANGLVLADDIDLGESQDKNYNFGLYGGIGTDLSLGLGFGAKGTIMPFGSAGNPLEIGAEVFFAHSEETTEEYGNEYVDTVDLIVFGFIANYLYKYSPVKPGMYFILGTGFAIINAAWEGSSDTDTTYNDSVEGTIAGMVLNFGLGYAFGSRFEFRVEVPIIIGFGQVGEAAGVMPTISFLLGRRF